MSQAIMERSTVMKMDKESLANLVPKALRHLVTSRVVNTISSLAKAPISSLDRNIGMYEYDIEQRKDKIAAMLNRLVDLEDERSRLLDSVGKEFKSMHCSEVFKCLIEKVKEGF